MPPVALAVNIVGAFTATSAGGGVMVAVIVGFWVTVTVRVTPWLVMPDSLAVIVVVIELEVSLSAAVAKPCEPWLLLIVATEVWLECQVTLLVKSWVVPSL